MIAVRTFSHGGVEFSRLSRLNPKATKNKNQSSQPELKTLLTSLHRWLLKPIPHETLIPLFQDLLIPSQVEQTLQCVRTCIVDGVVEKEVLGRFLIEGLVGVVGWGVGVGVKRQVRVGWCSFFVWSCG